MIHAAINNSSLSGLHTLVVNSSSNFRVNVFELFLMTGNTVNVAITSVNFGSGSGTLSLGVNLTGPLPFARNAALHWPLQERADGIRVPHFQTELGDNLALDISDVVLVSGYLKYTVEGLGDV